MAVYEWRGINASGKSVKGIRDADSPKALRNLLRRDGVLVTEVMAETEARRVKAREIDLGRYFRPVTGRDIALLTRQVATLLRAGIPLVEALSAVIDQIDKPHLKTAMTQVRDKVNEGSSLADALRLHPRYFQELYVNMVAAGEASGNLETVLARLSDFLESQNKLKTKVIGAMAYPAFMLLMSFVVMIVMVTVVVPKVTAIFDDFEAALPWYTQLLKFISDTLTSWWGVLIAMVCILGIWGFVTWKRTPEGRKKWDLFVLRVPLFGQLVLKVAMTRFARTLSTLLGSGVPVLTALEITRNVLGNTELMRVLEDARGSIREGESIAQPLRSSGRFPPIVTHMITIGERSGQLEEMLEHVAAAYEQEVDAQVTAMTSLIEPVLIIMVGGSTGGIAFSILMPLMQINEFIR